MADNKSKKGNLTEAKSVVRKITKSNILRIKWEFLPKLLQEHTCHWQQ